MRNTLSIFFPLTRYCNYRPAGTARKSTQPGNTLRSAIKQVGRDVEALETDPEEVTEEMMETAYFRYGDCHFADHFRNEGVSGTYKRSS